MKIITVYILLALLLTCCGSPKQGLFVYPFKDKSYFLITADSIRINNDVYKIESQRSYFDQRRYILEGGLVLRIVWREQNIYIFEDGRWFPVEQYKVRYVRKR